MCSLRAAMLLSMRAATIRWQRKRVAGEELAMSHLATGWRELRIWSADHSAELRLCVRSTTAAVHSLAPAHLLHQPLAHWAVLPAAVLSHLILRPSSHSSHTYYLHHLRDSLNPTLTL